MGWSRITLLAIDRNHCHQAHERWAAQHLSDAFRTDWIERQCGGCRFYITLEGDLGSDWGACSNPVSPRDGRLMFEHDGCEHHEVDTEPVTEELVVHLLRKAKLVTEEAAEARGELVANR